MQDLSGGQIFLYVFVAGLGIFFLIGVISVMLSVSKIEKAVARIATKMEATEASSPPKK